MQTLLRTPLFDRHVALGARMVPFAGWEMPVQYEGVIPEHMAVRTDSGVFDVSHMGELEVEGPRAHELLQSTLSNDLRRLADGEAQYALLTNESGGIVDDLIVYRLSPFRFLLIVNAANREGDYEWLKEREIAGSDVRDISDEYALLAVQGPRSLERLGLGETAAFTFAEGEIDGIACMINRTGYTGEQGVELMVPAEDAPQLWDRVVERGATPAGLGARDKEFTGVAELRRVKEEGPQQKRAAFVMKERAIPRQGMPIEGGGEVTSGTHSPMLDRGIGMGYVPAERAAPDTELTIDVRGK